MSTQHNLQTRPSVINTVDDLIAMYPGQLDRIGKYPGKAKLVIDPDAPPHVDTPRKTPIAYHFNLEYKPGKEMALADTLSRLPSKMNDSTIELDTRVHTVRFTKERLDIIREETKKDQSPTKLISTIINGWPDSIKDLLQEIRSYWSYRDELSMEDGLIFKGERIIIPNSQKQTILDQLRYAHQGVEKTKLRARDSVYWNQINQS